MAKCQKIETPPPVEPLMYRLELTDSEAAVLLDIGKRIGGPPSGRRKIYCAIVEALEKAGALGRGTNDMQEGGRHCALYFKD